MLSSSLPYSGCYHICCFEPSLLGLETFTPFTLLTRALVHAQHYRDPCGCRRALARCRRREIKSTGHDVQKDARKSSEGRMVRRGTRNHASRKRQLSAYMYLQSFSAAAFVVTPTQPRKQRSGGGVGRRTAGVADVTLDVEAHSSAIFEEKMVISLKRKWPCSAGRAFCSTSSIGPSNVLANQRLYKER